MALTDVLGGTSTGYYEPAFRQVLEEHLPLIKNHSDGVMIPIEPYKAVRYKGDFFGLLAEMRVPDYLRWITMRVNGFISPGDSTDALRAVRMVNESYIRRLYNTHRTQSKIKRKN